MMSIYTIRTRGCFLKEPCLELKFYSFSQQAGNVCISSENNLQKASCCMPWNKIPLLESPSFCWSVAKHYAMLLRWSDFSSIPLAFVERTSVRLFRKSIYTNILLLRIKYRVFISPDLHLFCRNINFCVGRKTWKNSLLGTAKLEDKYFKQRM